MDKVIFLDRDGTLNQEVHYLHRKEDLVLLDGVPEALKLFKQRGYRLVVVTNQAGVARGYYPEEAVKELHGYMNQLLYPLGVQIDRFFYCPHHPQYGIGPYKRVCRCRKPGTGMFEMAAQVYDIDRRASWMIGDKIIDVEAGNRYGLHTALVGTGYGSSERALQKPGTLPPYEIYADTLLEAARIITAESEVGKNGITGKGAEDSGRAGGALSEAGAGPRPGA